MSEALWIDGCEILHLENHFTWNILPLWIEVLQFTSDHLCNDDICSKILGIPGSNVVAVTHDGDLVADSKDLVHLMGYVDNGDSVSLKVLYDSEEGFNLILGQG